MYLREQPAAVTERPQDGALVQHLLTFEALAENSTSLVLVEVDGASEFDYLDVPHTFSVATVVRSYAGDDLEGQEVGIWQTGTAEEPLEGLARPLRSGHTYLLYIEPLWFEEGKVTDDWVVVAQGSWIEEGEGFVLDVPLSEGETLGVDAKTVEEISPELEHLVMELPTASALDALTRLAVEGWTS